MQGLNDGYFFVIDKIIDLQSFFLRTAYNICYITLLTAILLAAVNYALTGTGLKENVIKIGKALVFFIIVAFLYPNIVGFITSWTFSLAKDSMYDSVSHYYQVKVDTIVEEAQAAPSAPPRRQNPQNLAAYSGTDQAAANKTFAKETVRSLQEDLEQIFNNILAERSDAKIKYTTVAPTAALTAVFFVAGECIRFADDAPRNWAGMPDFGQVLKGLICAFVVIVTGVFGLLEYLIAFLEFMLVSSVGVILLPLSVWEGSKFMTEKFYGAMIGFFIKLLFCNLAIFLMLFGFITLAHQFSATPFKGEANSILSIVFICLLYFYICKSAPGLAQSLLTGTPSLSATGAISAVAGAAGAVAGGLGLAKGAGSAIAGGGAKLAFGGVGALTEAGAAMKAAGDLGGSAKDKAGAFMGSLAHSAGESLKASGGDLARSLIGGDKGGGVGSGGSGAGINRHSQTQKFLGETNKDGTKKSFEEQQQSRREAGTNAGIDYMAKK